MSEHQQLCDLIANLINEQQRTTEAIVQLTEALAGIRQVKVAKAETEKAITKAKTEPVAPVPLGVPGGETTAQSPAATAPLDYQRDVSPTMAKLLAAKGAPSVVEILASVGAKNKHELKPEHLATVLAAAKQALGE